MPPRIARSSRGAGGGLTGSSPHMNKAMQSQQQHQPEGGESILGGSDVDTNHNSDQPCCSILTRVARSIFPSNSTNGEKSRTKPQDTTTVTEGNDSRRRMTPPEMETHHDWYTLLRGYLILERMNAKKNQDANVEILSASASNQKKKKKKKKRKNKKVAGSTGMIHPETTLQESATEFLDVVEQDEEGEEIESHIGADTTATSTSSTPLDVVEPSPPLLPYSTPFSHTHTASSVEWDQRVQQERIRRIELLLNRFIDRVCHDDSEISKSATADCMRWNISQLQDFVSTIFRNNNTASLNGTNGTSFSVPASKQSQRDHSSPILISWKQIETELQNICCPACRNDVANILLPNLTTSSSSMNMTKHPPFRQLLLKHLAIPTIYDTIDQELELEQRATQYQSLMEEGVTPPEHTRYWSFHVLTEELPVHTESNTSKLSASSSSVATAKESEARPRNRPQQCTVIGWELHRPIVFPQHVSLNGLPEPPLNEMIASNHSEETTTTNHNNGNEEWTMTQLKFLIDHYVLLIGLPADEINTPTVTTTTIPSKTLTANDYASISSNVSGKVRALAEKFIDMASMIERSYQQFVQSKKYQVENTGCATDWQTFAILKNEIDETCRVVMNELLNINIDITRAVHRVVSHMSAGIMDDDLTVPKSTAVSSTTNGYSRNDAMAESKWATAHCQSIWQAYITGCTSIISEREKYEAQLFHLAEDRVSGKYIPDMMVSPSARSLYSMFVNSKLGLVVNTMQIIERQLNAATFIGGWHSTCSTNTNATFVARLYTEDLFFTVIHGSSESDHTCPDMDQSFEDVLKAIREMTDTVYEQRVDVVLEKYQQQREKLYRIINKTIALLDDDDDDDDATPVMTSFRHELGKIQNIPWHDDAKNQFSEWKSTINKAIETWVHYRLDYTVPGFQKQPTPNMPYELRRSMRPDTTVLFSEQTQQCRGGNGQHRAICILVGLLFEHLHKKFEEWQAQRAAQELLTLIVDDQEIDVTVPTAPKSSKKLKRKVKKNIPMDNGKDTLNNKLLESVNDTVTDSDDEVLLNDTMQSSFTNNEVDESCTLHDNDIGNDVKNTKYQTTESTTIVTTSEDDGNFVEINSGREETSINGAKSTIDQNNELHFVSLECNTGTKHDNMIETIEPFREDVVHAVEVGEIQNAGVHDITFSDGFQSAEDFMIGRFHQIINSNKTIVIIP